MAKKVKKCKVGYSCGSSCIQVTKACLKEFPEGVSVALDNRQVIYAKKIKEKEITTAKPTAKTTFSEAELKEYQKGAEAVSKKYRSKLKSLNDRQQSFQDQFDKSVSQMQSRELYLDFEGREALGLPKYGVLDPEDRAKADIELEKRKAKDSDYQRYFKNQGKAAAKLAEINKAKRGIAKQMESEFSKLPGYDNPALRAEDGRRLMLQRWGEGENQRPKINKFKENGLSEEEATAMAAWISFGDYSDINKAIYDRNGVSDPRYWDALDQVNALIPKAVAKLPKSNREDMLNQQRENLGWDDVEEDFLPPGQFQRGISVADPEAFIANFAQAKGQIIRHDTHVAATNLTDLDFVESANVVYRIKGKDDGTGKSIAMDEYKNFGFEGEVFWPAGAEFAVLEAAKGPDGKYYIDLEEA